MRLSLVVATALLVSALASPAFADGEINGIISKFDEARLSRFDAVKSEALAEARAKGDAADIAVLEAALAGQPLPLDGSFNPNGTWRCRVLKLGKLSPLVVYPQFKCRISDDGSGWRLRKLTGSQRTAGRLFTDSETRLTYLGAGTVNDDPVRDYGDDPKFDEVAFVERLGKRKLVFQFPEPQLESLFDILVLER